MRKIFYLGLLPVLLGSLALGSCTENKPNEPDDPNNPNNPDDPGKPEVKVRHLEDTREAVYKAYNVDGSELGTFNSLYLAINSAIVDGDRGSYVLVENNEEKVFVNFDGFDPTTQDMFWYYDQTQLAGYEAWSMGYDQRLKNTNFITIMNEYANVGAPYMNGYELVGVGEVNGSETVPVWNTHWQLETSATVDMIAYSGITKSVYDIDLTEAKIAPTYENDMGIDTTAMLGFTTADSELVAHLGIACDTTTGNWYVYKGKSASHASTEYELDKSNVILTSTWNETEKCYRPDSDVKLTLEILTLDIGTEDERIINRLTIDKGDSNPIVVDHELPKMTQCSTIRFQTILDINNNDSTVQDYMNGSYFKNVIVRSATGHVLEEIVDPVDGYYGQLNILNPGEYNLLNSSGLDNEARYQTILYTASCINANFDNGQDVYNLSFALEANTEHVYTEDLETMIDSIKALPTTGELTPEQITNIQNVNNSYNDLLGYKKNVIAKVMPEVLKQLQDAAAAAGITE